MRGKQNIRECLSLRLRGLGEDVIGEITAKTLKWFVQGHTDSEMGRCVQESGPQYSHPPPPPGPSISTCCQDLGRVVCLEKQGK